MGNNSHKKKKEGTQCKRGRFSAGEMEFMTANESVMTVEKMANLMNRTPEAVKGWLDTNNAIMGKGGASDTVYAIRKELRDSLAWRQLREEFTPQEVCYFEEQYVGFMKQFRDDVFASEQNQIFQAIKLDILMSRNLKQRRRTLQDVDNLEQMQADLLKGANNKAANLSSEDKNLLQDLTTQISAGRANDGARTSEYTRLQEKHESIIHSLKATRQQRITKIEDDKESFINLIKRLQNEEVREREGRSLGLLQMAIDKEAQRLGSPHEFADGAIDRPVLSAETLGVEDEDV